MQVPADLPHHQSLNVWPHLVSVILIQSQYTYAYTLIMIPGIRVRDDSSQLFGLGMTPVSYSG